MRRPSPISFRRDPTRLAAIPFVSLAKIAFVVGAVVWVPVIVITAIGAAFNPGGFTINGADVEGLPKVFGTLITGMIIATIVNGFVSIVGAFGLRMLMTLIDPSGGGGSSSSPDRLVR